MRSMPVVLLDVLGEDDLKLPAAKHEESIEALAPPHGTHEPLCDGVRPRGEGIGVLMTPMPSPPKTASKDEVNFVSRSRSKNLAAVVRSARSEQTFRLAGSPRPGRVRPSHRRAERGGCRVR